MLKKSFFLILFINSFILSAVAFANTLNLESGKTYILNFEEEILNINADEKKLNAQILHTIFDDRTQLVLSLNNDNESILQVKTEKNFYNYNVKKSDTASKELIEIDVPPFENLDVDIYTGEK